MLRLVVADPATTLRSLADSGQAALGGRQAYRAAAAPSISANTSRAIEQKRY